MSAALHLRSGLWPAVLTATALLMSGCGGGGGGTPPPPPPPPAPVITTTSIPTAIVGKSYQFTLQASGGSPPYTWSVAADSNGQLAPGLTLSATGVISGTPTAAGGGDIDFQVRDSASMTVAQVFNFIAVPQLGIDKTQLQNGNVGIAYADRFFTIGGISPFTWSVTAGSVPPGLTLSRDGSCSGTPSTPGSFSFTVQVTDSATPPEIASAATAIVIENKVSITTNIFLPQGILTRQYTVKFQAVGGTPPYTWGATQGANGQVPPGLVLDPSTGTLSGTPTSAGFFGFSIQVKDNASPPQTASSQGLITINQVPSFQTTSLPDAVLTVGYVGFVSIQGGISPFAATVAKGALPSGINLPTGPLSQNLFLSGGATTVGTYNFTLEVTDSSAPPFVIQQDFSLRVDERLLFTPFTLPDGLEGSPYNGSVPVTGGVPPYTWSVDRLPAGLTLSTTTGQINGTPTEVFNDAPTFTITDTSKPPQFLQGRPALNIIGKLRITTSALPAVKSNAPFRALIGLHGGTLPISWSVSAGALPAGLTLNGASGEISGNPTAEGVANFTLRVADSGTGTFAQSASQPLSLAVKAAGTLGRNDSPATATPLSNGTYQASISPFVDPPTATSGNPDTDYYRLTANAGAVVTVIIKAQRLTPPSPLDSVIEIVDSNGKRFATCAAPNSGGDGPYTFPCVNDDDLRFNTTDSRLVFQASGSASGPLTFFVHVLDFRGDARPDFLYTITIDGAN
jgi:hypothetical protein